MGAATATKLGFAAQFSEVVGFKAGVALTQRQIHEHLIECPSYDGLFKTRSNSLVRLRSEIIQQLVTWLLWRVGYLRKGTSGTVTIDLFHKYKHMPSLLKIHHALCRMLYIEFLPNALAKSNAETKGFNPSPFIEKARKKFGLIGAAMALEQIESLDHEIRANALSRIRSVEWCDIVPLTALFKSESLDPTHGRYIDQRFIDYLSANNLALDSMNWRKFEALTAEYFERNGYRVEIGPGRNDGGVDIRVWKDETKSVEQPPLVLVQCKRQKASIDKVLVKALWADVVAENASSGLIVTTSHISPGAKAVVSARQYLIQTAERATLKEWLTEMRSPGAGVFLGE